MKKYVMTLTHAMSLFVWGYFAKNNLIAVGYGSVNLASLLLGAVAMNALYVQIVDRDERVGGFYDVHVVVATVITLGLTSPDRLSLVILFTVSMGQSIARWFWHDKRDALYWLVVWLTAQAVYFYVSSMLAGVLVTLVLFYDTYRKYGYRHIDRVSFIPIPPKIRDRILLIAILSTVIGTIVLDLDPLTVNIIYQIILWLLLLFTRIHLFEKIDDGEAFYEETTDLYFLVDYISHERAQFASVLHDDIIQQLRGVLNLLSLSSPDVDRSRDILTDLETKMRKIINFYSSEVFLEYSAVDNINTLIACIQPLYPDQRMDIQLSIDEQSRFAFEDKELYRCVLNVSRELINNAYKHSCAKWIALSIDRDVEGGILRLQCANDGVDSNQYDRTSIAKRGIVMVETLIKKRHGVLHYTFEEGVLTAHISMELKKK